MFLTKSIKIKENLAKLSFILLFPLFFFYHFSIGINLIPPFLGGYFGIVASIFILPFFYLSLKELYKLDTVEILFFILLIYSLLMALINYSLGLPSSFFEKDMLKWSVSGIIFNYVSYAIGKNLKLSFFFEIIILILFSTMFFVVISNINYMNMFYIRMESANQETVATYQGFARSILLTLLVLISYFYRKSFLMYLLISSLGLIVLFFNGARSELFLFLVSEIFILFLTSVKKVKFFAYLIVFIFAVSIITFFIFNLYSSNRVFTIFNLSESESYLLRRYFFEFGLNRISESPLLGDYGSYVTLGGIGCYPHNIFSAWINLGIFGFLLYIIISVLLWVNLYRFYKKTTLLIDIYLLYALLLIITTLSLLFTKDYTYMLFGFTVGVYKNCQSYFKLVKFYSEFSGKK